MFLAVSNASANRLGKISSAFISLAACVLRPPLQLMHINGIATMLSGTRELTASIVSLEASASAASGAGAGSNLNTPDCASPAGLGASFAASQKLVRVFARTYDCSAELVECV